MQFTESLAQPNEVQGAAVEVSIVEEQRRNTEVPTGTARRLANLRPWRAGQPSPNPNGRPRGQCVTSALRRLLDQGNTAEQIAAVIVREALKGDIDFVKVLLDRTDGAVTKHFALTDGLSRDPKDMTDEELLAVIVESVGERGNTETRTKAATLLADVS